MKEELMAPCGMNCGICMAYLRKQRGCPGCHGDDTNKSASCIRCVIRNCEVVKTSESGFCFECAEYPCRRLRQLDKRYRMKYAMSMIENLESIKKIGLVAFVEEEKQRLSKLIRGKTLGVSVELGKSYGRSIRRVTVRGKPITKLMQNKRK